MTDAANLDTPPASGTVRVKIDNVYEDDYQFTSHFDLPAPTTDDDIVESETWWEQHVYTETGGRTDGQGHLDAGYFAEIVEINDADDHLAPLVGAKWEWC